MDKKDYCESMDKIETNAPSIKKNYIYNTAYQILNFIVPVITAPYISRVLGADGVGIQSYTTSIVYYFTLLATLGTTLYGQREIAMCRDDKVESSRKFWEIEVLSIITTSGSLIVWTIFLLNNHSSIALYYLPQTMTIIAVFFDISWFYAGKEQFRFVVIRNSAVKIIGTVLLFLLIHEREDLYLYIALLALIGLIGNITMWTYLPRFICRVQLIGFRKNLVRHLQQTFSYFIPTLAISVYTVMDKTMIGVITRNSFENGYYEQASKIVRMSASLIMSLNTVMTSRMSWLFANNRIEEIKTKLRDSMNFCLLLSIPMMFGLIGISHNFVIWFFGPDYGRVAPIMCVYSLLIFPISITNCISYEYLTPSGQRSKATRGIIAGAITNFVLNALLIPLSGAIGASIASVAAEFAVVLVYMTMCNGFMSWILVFRIAWKKFLAASCMFGIVLLIGFITHGGIVTSLLQVIIGGLSYLLLLLLFKDRYTIGLCRYMIKH